jgi:carboxylesterase type B
MGFFAHPELSEENHALHGSYASGNYGLLDLIKGLQWIKQNIAAFGTHGVKGDASGATLRQCRSTGSHG